MKAWLLLDERADNDRERLRLESHLLDGMDRHRWVFIPGFLRMNPPPAMPLAPGAQHHSWTNWFRVEIQVFHVDFFIFLFVMSRLSSGDWTHAKFWGGDGWSLSTLKAGDPEGCRYLRRSPVQPPELTSPLRAAVCLNQEITAASPTPPAPQDRPKAPRPTESTRRANPGRRTTWLDSTTSSSG